jgi:Tfp pilus assembly protein PilO
MSPARLRFDIRRAGKVLVFVYLGLLVASAAFFVLMTRPALLEYRALTVESAPRLKALADRQAQVEAREEYGDALDQAKLDLERLRDEVLSTRRKRMIAIQLEVDDLAREFNITAERISHDNEILEDEGLERYAMVVPLTGGYRNLRNFIRAVENSDEFLVVERVALARGQEGGVLLQLNITLATYFDLPEIGEPGGRRRGA